MANDKSQGWRSAFASSVVGACVVVLWKLLSWLPIDRASDLGGFLGRHVFVRVLKPRTITKNLRTAFPALPDSRIDELTRGIFDNFGRVAAEITHLDSFRKRRNGTSITIEGREHLVSGQPAIFVGGHLSNWEIGVVAIAQIAGRLNAIVTPLGVPVIDRRLEAFRAASGANYLPRSSASLRTIFGDLANGTSVAMLVDQRVGTGPRVHFFGRPTISSSLPATLAVRFGIPIIPVDGERVTPSHFIVRFHKPIWPGQEAVGDKEIQLLSQKMMTAIEGFVRSSPETWFCHKARWKPQDADPQPIATPGDLIRNSEPA